MLKKLLYKLIFLTIIFNLFTYNSFAEGTCESGCKIKSGTPEVILEYISNNKKIIQNISKNLGDAKSQINIPTSINTSGTNINTNNSFSTGIGLRIYNSLFNWKETESGFKYFLSNIDGDVPFPIKRDLQLIDNQNRSLNYFLSKVIKNGYSFNDIDSKKACEGIEDNGKCVKFLGNDIEIAIKNLIDNNSKINLLLRKELGFMGFQSIVGDNSYEKLFLIPENFKQEVKNNYNKETYKSCAECSGGSIDRVKKTINKIILNDKQGKDGISEWVKAWDLLLGIKDDKNTNYNKIERNLLNQELSRQGISSNNGQAVLNDLKNFKGNSFGFSLGNNPITNSFNNFIEEIEEPFRSKTVNNFTETISNIANSLPDKEVFTLSEIKYTETNLGNDKLIYNKIKETIKKNQAIISRQNKNTDKLQLRIIQLHINLSQTINTLEKIIPKAEKICNDQDSGNGICSFKK